ncbi:MAG: hypothetical protein KGL39_24580 [Patescibacteria group bacterium]|nr:hypothetical protein [Patescibacteria group bacterium]
MPRGKNPTQSSQEQMVERSQKKLQKFKKLANIRVNRTLKLLTMIGNLSNKATYTYDRADVDKIIDALQKGVDEIEKRFGNPETKVKQEFSL